jgi:putative flippase GtrA
LKERVESLAVEPVAAPTGGIIARAVDYARTNKEFERFWKFAVVGAIGAVIDFGTYTALNALGWLDPVTVRLPFGLRLSGLGISGGIAFTLAVMSNFIWNRYWTYPDSRSKPLVGQIITFFLVNVVGILIRIPIIELGSAPLARLAASVVRLLSPGMAEWVGESASWAIAVVIVMFWNFFVNRYWTYNDVD